MSTNQKTHEQFLRELAEKAPGVEAIGRYEKALKPMSFRCTCGSVYEAKPTQVIHLGRLCSMCMAKKKKKKLGASDNDAIYCWELLENGESTGIYKVGLTSARLGDFRITHATTNNGMEYRTVFLLRTTPGDAIVIERALLDSGHPVNFKNKFDGGTEFRRFGPKGIATLHAMAKIATAKPREQMTETLKN